MSERRNPRLDNFDANKKAFEKEKFEEALYGDAGTEDFSDTARRRVEEADAYERHMERLATETRSDYDRGLDRLESGEEESAAYNREWDDAIAENESFNATRAAESAALAEKFATNVKLRQMDRISEEIHRLRTEGKDDRRLSELEDRLQELLIAYSESEDYDQHIADMLMDRGDEKALANAAKSALERKSAPKEKPEEEIKTPKTGELINEDEEESEASTPEIKEPKTGELTNDTAEPEAETAETKETETPLRRARRMGAALVDLVRRRREAAEPEINDEAEPEEAEAAAEVEETPEKEPMKLTVGSREAMSSYHRVSEDYLLSDTENKIFGVFDGMGGEGGSPDAASRAAAEAAHKSILEAGEPTSTDELGLSVFNAFIAARENVTTNGEGGSTVGTLIRLAEIDGENYLAIAHAGDTRLLAYRTRVRELTTDQSDGNEVHNGLISGSKGNSRDEYKVVKIPKGVRLMLCSDGITGDWAHQFLSDEEMLDAFTQPTPDAAAQRFMEVSKKDDDKTVIVIDVE